MTDLMSSILIVEDSPSALYRLQDILEGAGFNVVTAADGLSALSALAQNQPDLIMLDIGLPGIDGISLCATIRRRPNLMSVPIFMITGSDKVGDKNLSGLFGAQAYITKPYSAETILNTVYEFLPANLNSSTRGYTAHG